MGPERARPDRGGAAAGESGAGSAGDDGLLDRVAAVPGVPWADRLWPDGEAVSGPLHLARERGRDEQMGVLEQAIELARFFGTELVRCFAFWKQGELTERTWEEIENAFRAAVALADREGIVLGLESMFFYPSIRASVGGRMTSYRRVSCR